MDYNLTLFKDSVKDILFAAQNSVSNKSSSLQDNSNNLVNSMLNNLSLHAN